MRTFVDKAGRTWTVSITVDAIKRVRDLLKEDLLDIGAVLPRLLVDPILLCDVIYVVCKPQADQLNISDTDFARAMAGDAIAAAKAALLEELVDFFHEPSQREALRLAIEKSKILTQKAGELIKARLNSPKLAQEIEAAFSTIGESFTNSPELSGSTQAR